ncbi:MAG: hypothetical protein OER21_02865 [Gemmatimonadota bacterium]|nr:hypothetical protein [Gemmatimonadota bacterium]
MDDATYGGYVARHGRPPAFTGSDGASYSVAVLVDAAPSGSARYGAAFLFVRWSPAGDRPAGHVESGFLTYGDTPDAAELGLREISLFDIKAHLDRAIAARVDFPDP